MPQAGATTPAADQTLRRFLLFASQQWKFEREILGSILLSGGWGLPIVPLEARRSATARNAQMEVCFRHAIPPNKRRGAWMEGESSAEGRLNLAPDTGCAVFYLRFPIEFLRKPPFD
jgi:hypothetical protein